MKDNKLIAEFMGGVLSSVPNLINLPQIRGDANIHSVKGSEVLPNGTYSVHRLSELKYHSSWDWLMPVVMRCYESDIKIEVGDITHGLLDCDLESTHQAVVEFIKTKNTMILKYEVQWDSDGDLTHIRYAQDFETIEEARIALALHHKRNAVLTVKQIRE